LPLYRFDPATGLWQNERGLPEPPMSLRDIDYREGRMTFPADRRNAPETDLRGYLLEAERIVAQPLGAIVPEELSLPEGFEGLRWFPLPHEAASGVQV